MGFEKVIYVSGKPGLYRVINKTSFGLVAESLSDGRRIPVYANHRVSHLTDIAIFTTGEENLPLKEAFLRLAEKTQGGTFDVGALQNEDDFRTAFAELVPEFDRQKVYSSDIKKFFNWFNLLQAKGLLPEKNSDENSEQEKETSQGTVKKAPTSSEKNKNTISKAASKAPSTSTKGKGGPKVNTPRKAG